MDFIGSSLSRLREVIGRIESPSAETWDISVIKAQIELRQRALRDIEVIRSRLRPFLRCDSNLLHCRLQSRRAAHSRQRRRGRRGPRLPAIFTP